MLMAAKKIKVILADCSSQFTRAIGEFLTVNNYEVAACVNRMSDLMTVLKATQADVLIYDYLNADESLEETFNEARKYNPDLKIMVMSFDIEPLYASEYKRAGANSVCNKNLNNYNDLLALINKTAKMQTGQAIILAA